MRHIRYHVQLKTHQTTVSVDTIVSDLMAIKLGTVPGTKEAHTAVRQKIDEFIDRDRGRPGYGLANHIREQAILFISDKILSEKYWETWEVAFENHRKSKSRTKNIQNKGK